MVSKTIRKVVTYKTSDGHESRNRKAAATYIKRTNASKIRAKKK